MFAQPLAFGDHAGTYSLQTESIEASGSFLLPHGPLANGYEVWEEFPPIPSVPLFLKLLAGPFERTMKVIGADGLDRTILVTVTVSREVRLAIGPADERETPRPMFEVRTVADMVDGDGWNWAGRRKWFYFEGTEEFTTQDEHGNEVIAEIELGPEPGVEGRWIPLLEEGDVGTSMPPHLEFAEQKAVQLSEDVPGPRQWEHVYAAWRPVTSISCADLLGRRLSEGRYALQLESGHPRGRTLLPNDIVGSWVESALTNGDRSLEKTLEADAERLSALVRDYIIRQRSDAEASHRRALAEWANEREHTGGLDD
jgi:hypothetical protein